MPRTEIAIAGLRGIATVSIAAAFLLLLMIASIQQTVVATIEREALHIDYSTALRMVGDVTEARVELSKRRSEGTVNRIDLARARTRSNNLERQVVDLVSQTKPTLDQLASSEGCPTLTATRAQAEKQIAEDWEAAALCFRTEQVPAPLRGPVERMLEISKRVGEVRRELEQVQGEVERLETEKKRIEAEMEALHTRIEGPGQKLEMLGYVLAMPVVGKSGLIETPPALLHIILAFVSGLFGAMLLSLVLAVYPHNEFRFAKSHGYFRRLFLGGLVSICVFVVVGGGVAVLETGGGVFDGSGNYMSFAAIGVLAGMFSDRVALWLSRRANSFFTSDAEAPGMPG